MLEKNKKCIEFSMRSMMLSRRPYQEDVNIEITGMIPGREIFAENPFDIPIDVVVIPRKEVERLQEYNQRYRELAKQWEENYNLLLKKTGFDTVEELVNYIHDNGPNSQMNWETLKEIINDAEEDYISERDKAEELQKENEELKKKLQVPDPFAEYKELFEKLQSKEDVEKFEWTLNHICGGQASVNGWMVTAKLWRRNYETLSKLVGFSSVEEIQDYLTNEAECDTLYEAISKLHDQVKYTCDEWYSANSSNNSWKAAAECNSPKELIEKRETLEGKVKVLETEAEVYSRTLQEWKEVTGYPSPSAVKTALESGASWCHAYHEIKAANEKLGEIIKSWKNVTGYSNPEVYMQARISGTFNTPFDYTAAWQKATGYDSPKNFLKWKANIEGIVEAWKLETGCTYPGEAGRLLEKWKTMTKCETPEAAATLITSYESACERGNRLAEGAAEREKEWQKATGCDTPGVAEERIKYYKKRLGNAVQAASCAAKHLDNITF